MLNETFLHTIDITTGVAVGSLIKNIRKNENFLNYINDKTSFLNFDAPIAVKLFYIRNRFDEQLKCKYCQTYITHIKSFCDRKCQGSYVGMNEDSKIKKSKTLSEVYSKKTQEEKDLIKHHRLFHPIGFYPNLFHWSHSLEGPDPPIKFFFSPLLILLRHLLPWWFLRCPAGES